MKKKRKKWIKWGTINPLVAARKLYYYFKIQTYYHSIIFKIFDVIINQCTYDTVATTEPIAHWQQACSIWTVYTSATISQNRLGLTCPPHWVKTAIQMWTHKKYKPCLTVVTHQQNAAIFFHSVSCLNEILSPVPINYNDYYPYKWNKESKKHLKSNTEWVNRLYSDSDGIGRKREVAILFNKSLNSDHKQTTKAYYVLTKGDLPGLCYLMQ